MPVVTDAVGVEIAPDVPEVPDGPPLPVFPVFPVFPEFPVFPAFPAHPDRRAAIRIAATAADFLRFWKIFMNKYPFQS